MGIEHPIRKPKGSTTKGCNGIAILFEYLWGWWTGIWDAKEVLDLGCGWGAVSLVLSHVNPEIKFTASDVSDRAIIYTRKNARKLKIKLLCKERSK